METEKPPSKEWNIGCEAYYLNRPVHNNPYCSHDEPDKYKDWEDGWEFAWKSCGSTDIDWS